MSSGTIDIDAFENADADEFEEQNDTERIVRFLDRNDDRAWKAAMIAEQLGLDTDAVSAILSRLKERDLVRHKRPYWAITVLLSTKTDHEEALTLRDDDYEGDPLGERSHTCFRGRLRPATVLPMSSTT